MVMLDQVAKNPHAERSLINLDCWMRQGRVPTKLSLPWERSRVGAVCPVWFGATYGPREWWHEDKQNGWQPKPSPVTSYETWPRQRSVAYLTKTSRKIGKPMPPSQHEKQQISEQKDTAIYTGAKINHWEILCIKIFQHKKESYRRGGSRIAIL